MKRHKGTLSAYYSIKQQSEKPTYCMIPTIWYSRKDITMETVKRVVAGVQGDRGRNRGQTGYLAQ